MRAFTYTAPNTLDEALAALAEGDEPRLLAGGTDLLGSARRGIEAPDHLINLKSIPELTGIHQTSDNGLAIGAATRLSDVAENPLVSENFPILAQAIAQTATPQIRNTGTLGGNLCQRPRCWYYRHPDFPCVRKQGEGCFAVGGQNRYHAIFGGHGCFIVHPSDSAPALIALDARVEIAGPDGCRELPLSDFFVGPEENLTGETALAPNEILTHIHIPPPVSGSTGVYLKASERRATDFALVSVAVVLARQDVQITSARVILGGVAPIPWRVPKAEGIIVKQGISAESIQQACEAAVEDAHPMSQNVYKVQLMKGLLKKGIGILAGDSAVVAPRPES
jgi:xanthine dehydrogenase YagS FAD-binding subunit